MLPKDKKTMSVHSRHIEATDHENSSALDHEPESLARRTTVGLLHSKEGDAPKTAFQMSLTGDPRMREQ